MLGLTACRRCGKVGYRRQLANWLRVNEAVRMCRRCIEIELNYAAGWEGGVARGIEVGRERGLKEAEGKAWVDKSGKLNT